MTDERIAGYRIHPAANLFPLMDEAELRTLADDIKANGQREPVIYIYTGDTKTWSYRAKPDPNKMLVLDGRNRLLACEMAGVEPNFCAQFEITGVEPDHVAYIVSKNLHRRHLNLTAEQRAAITIQAAELSGALAKAQAEAQERKRAGKTLPPRGGKVGTVAEAVADIAKGGTSPRTVERVMAATKDNPEALDAIAKGTTTASKVKATKPIRFKKGNDARITSLKLALSSAQETVDSLEEHGGVPDLVQQAKALVEAIKAVKS